MNRKNSFLKQKKNIVIYIIFFLIISVMILLCIEICTDLKVKKKTIAQLQNNMQNINTQSNENQQMQRNIVINKAILEETQETQEVSKEEIIAEYKGYDVLAKLEIPEIELETYILKNYSKEALNVSVTKFWGANPNEVGNFCVAGHNFKNKNMFYNLKNLQVGDEIFVSDNIIGKLEYKIYDLYKVEPKDVSCLSQDTNGNKEITLITCTNDSKKRIIVKARIVK